MSNDNEGGRMDCKFLSFINMILKYAVIFTGMMMAYNLLVKYLGG